MNRTTPNATLVDRRAAVVRLLVERSRRLGMGLMTFLLVLAGLPLIEADADTPGLEVALITDPLGAVKPGDPITYQYSIYNGTGQTLAELNLAADLPDGLTPTGSRAPVIARAFTLTASDDFGSGTFEGTAGSHDWTGPWAESPEQDGPTEGSVKATTTATGDPVAELRGNGSQLSRTVDLTGFPVAYLTYRIKQLDLPENATITVAVSNPETGILVAIDRFEGVGSGFTDPGFETTTVDITGLAGPATTISFTIDDPGFRHEGGLAIDQVAIHTKPPAAIFGDVPDLVTQLTLLPGDTITGTFTTQLEEVFDARTVETTVTITGPDNTFAQASVANPILQNPPSTPVPDTSTTTLPIKTTETTRLDTTTTTVPEVARVDVPLAADKLALPMTFEQNRGQADPVVDYLARGKGYTVFIDDGSAILALGHGENGFAVRMNLQGVPGTPQAVAHGQQPGVVNYFIGNDPAKWQRHVPTFGAIEYRDVYPGIDLRYYGDDRQLEYDFIVQPGADPHEIALNFEGATSLALTATGDLEIGLNRDRTVTFSAPHTYQGIDGKRVPVDSGYFFDGDTVGFSIGEYDPGLPLIIDPTLDYGTYFGGSDGADTGVAVRTDGAGNVYVTGYTASTNFPAGVGAYDTSANGSNDVFVAKFNPAGTTLLWASYLGGSGLDNGKGIAIDGTGAVYVGVYTASSNFPTTGGAYDTSLGGLYDGAVAKLSADGATLVYSTYLGGSANNDYLEAIAVDGSGQAVVAGSTDSSNYPTVAGSYDTSFGGTFDGFVTKVNATGTGLAWSTFVGGAGSDGIDGMVLDGSGTVYMTGQAASGFPTTAGAYDTTHHGGFDAWVGKLSSNGSTLSYSTLLGSAGTEKGTTVDFLDSSTVFVAGNAGATGFPTTAGAYDTTYGGNDDVFIARLDLTQTGSAQLVYSTYLGGALYDRAEGLDVDAFGRAHLAGWTQSSGLATGDGHDTTLGGSADGLFAILSADGSAKEYASYVGGASYDSASSIALTGSGAAWITGYTQSGDFPTTAGAYDSSLGGTDDAYLLRFGAAAAPSDPAVVVVNSTGDASDSNPGDDVCDTGGTVGSDPECTLRAAMEEANASAVVDTIHFAIPATDAGHSGGVWTISPGSVLPAITAVDLVIDASTQTGYSSTPVVEIDGTSTGAGGDGFRLQATGVTICGFAINRFPGDGVEIPSTGSGAIIVGNHLGVDASGLIDRGNGGHGVDLQTGSSGATIGGTTAPDRNVISGNGLEGMVLVNSDGNTIIGNYIGTDVTGNAAIPNTNDGIHVASGSDNNIFGQPGAGNVISANGNDALEFDDVSSGNVIQANIIGLGADGSTVLANGRHGVVLYNGANTTQIGGSGAGEGNVISGNVSAAVVIDGNANAATTGNMIEGNLIGTDTTGTLDRGNGTYGVYLFGGAVNTTIGGTTAGAGNTISGNGSDGIFVTGAATSGTLIHGNYIGLTAAGDAALGNTGNGVEIDWEVPNQIIGGTAAGAGNVISANLNGIYSLWANDMTIQGNIIGLDATGTVDLGNVNTGIRVGGTNVVIGGVTASARNVVSGNNSGGILLDSATSAVVRGNYVGIDITGMLDLGNGSNGVYVMGSANQIGGTAAGAGNVISGNANDGIQAAGSSTGTVIEGNTIGLASDGSTPLPNSFRGISLYGTGTRVGGTTAAAANTISGNFTGVVVVTGATDAAILGNAIYGNSGLGIDLANNGVTANDAGDGDTGANDLLNFPVITTATASGGTVTVEFDLDVPAGNYRVEFFDNAAADSSGYGEGESLVGSIDVSVTGGVPTPASHTFAGSPGDIITATTTEGTAAPFGPTSEFSAAATVVAGNNPPVFDQDLLSRTDSEASWISLSSAATDPDAGDTLTYSATGLPLGLSIDSATGLITGMVNYYAAASSPYSVEITVCDDGAPIECDVDTFTWTITNVLTTDPYVVADSGGGNGGDDLLTEVSPLDLDPVTNEVDIGTGTGTTTLRGLAIEPVSGVLYAAAGDRLGTLHVDSGVFTPVGGTFGSGDGDQGVMTFDSVVGLAFHPLTGELFAVHHVAADRDLLFNVDPATGSAIAGTFNAGRDYVDLGGSAPLEVTDIAIDPTDWATYGMFTDGAGSFELRAINRWNGSTNKVGDVTPEIRGLTVQSTGQMWGTDSGTLYEVDKTSGMASNPRTLDNGSQYGAVALAVPPAYPPAVEGIVFEDIFGNGVPAGESVQDFLNPGVGGVTMRLYLDDGPVPGEPDAGDTLWANKLTGPTGHYFFSSIPAGAYWLTADSSDVSPTAGGTGWAEQTYGPAEAVTFNGSYSFALSAGPLYGGMRPIVSDNAASLATAEHVVRVDLSPGEEIEQVDLGFSFNVVTNLEGGDGTSPQGSLRRFIINANNGTGPNALRFVPVVPTTGTDGVNKWWTVPVTTALPAIADDATTIDGTTYDIDGMTLIDLNTLGPELEISGPGAVPVMNGLVVTAAGNAIRDVAIGGFGSSAGVLISGSSATGSTITSAYLGTTATGTAANPNGLGVRITGGAADNAVGGTTSLDTNVISGNTGDGVLLDGAGTSGNTVERNIIGMNATGVAVLANGGAGITIDDSAAGTLVGGTVAGAANVIAYNGGDGVDLTATAGSGNTVVGNIIFANAGLGIDLGSDGVTANDAGDGDGGPNGLLNFPVIILATEVLGTISVDFYLDAPAGDYRIEFFTNPTGIDPSGYGEGESFAGTYTIVGHPGGSASYTTTFPGWVGDEVAATATEDLGASYGSTSEFSASFTVASPNDPPSAVAGGPYEIAEGEDLVLDGSGSSDPDTDPLTYNWDLDGDLGYDDATGVNPTVAWATLVGLGVDDDGGPFTIGLEVDDGNGGTDTATAQLTVTNTAPTISVTGSGSAVAGSSYTLNLGVTDPGDDTVTSWTINWGDGSIQTIPGNPATAIHTYTNAGLTNNILTSVIDEDGTWHQNGLIAPAFNLTSVFRFAPTSGAFVGQFGTITSPFTALVGPDGLLYVSSYGGDRVLRYNAATGALVGTFVASGSGGLNGAAGLAFGPDGNLYVGSNLTNSVLRYDAATGAFLNAFVPTGSGGLNGIGGIVFGPTGDLYVAGFLSDTVHRFDGKDGSFVSAFVGSGSGGLNGPEGLTFGPDGNLYVSSSVTNEILRYNGTTGAFIDAFVTAGSGGLTYANHAGFGPDGHLYVASGGTDEVLRYSGTTGAIIDEFVSAGDGGFDRPYLFTFLPGHQVYCDPLPDITPPVITLVGANPQVIEVGTAYVELGATALDDVDGVISGSIVIDASGVDTFTVGSYSVNYDVSDASGNAAVQVTRTVDVVDTTAPVVTLVGANPQTIEVGSVYSELGATASDNYDGNISSSIVIDATAVNTAAVGPYPVFYDVTDANGNPGSAIRTVNVVDTTIPVVSLTGANPQTIEVGSSYTELGASASDNYDGDISGSILIDATGVDTSTVGSYVVTYDVSDANGNAAVTVTRTVDIVDTTIPVVTLVGADPQAIEVGSPYIELGATASDNYDGDISGSIVIDTTGVDTNTVGSYVVTYDVTDANGNNAFTVIRTINVVDTTIPVITLSGANPQAIEVGSPYIELGATASDNYDGDISGSIVIDATGVNAAVVGSYVVTYDVSDANGNAAVQVNRTVNVVDTTVPVIILTGANPQIIEVDGSYTELGATASDNYDGDISGSIVIDATAVDVFTVGSYAVFYDVVDANGNPGSAIRTVNVVDTTLPVITLVGADPVTIEVGSPYVELGATASDNYDGDISGSIVIDATAVNNGVVGSYSVTYDVVDANGNAAITVSRTVDVVDTTVPVITLVGGDPQTIEVGSPYTELGASASDNYDGDITGSIVIDGTGVDTSTVGSYVVTYDVSDANGNVAVTVSRIVDVVDTGAPVIALVGADPVTVEVGSPYVDAGATAFDVGDGDLTGLIVTVNPVNTAVIGSYTVTYDVTDSQSNPAVQVTRTVNVVDTTVPVITLSGANPQSVEVGSAYTELGATASDNYDGDLSGSIVIDATGVDTSTVGSYVVTYDVSDANGNAAVQVIRTVNVVDTTVPVIAQLGSDPVTVEVGSPYVDAGATAFDIGDGDITAGIVTVNPVNTAVVGSYVVTYDVTDSQSNSAVQVTRTVNVVDTTIPVVTLVGANPQIIEVGSPYVELGATASDNYDGDLSGSISIDASAVNTAVVGSYSVTYDVSDANGNAAATVTRTVNVVDTTVPVVTLVGANPQTIEVGSSYVELGATASDNYDGNISGSIVIDTTGVDTNTVGSYVVTYDVSDAHGNDAVQVTRTVNVVDTTIPVVTLVGVNPQTIEVGSVYSESGATAVDAYDGNITVSIVIDSSAVNTAVVGTYPVFYDVTDANGNPGSAIRTVNVVDTTIPVITLTGAGPQTIEVGTAYVELGATALDNYDGNITGSIVIDSSAVNTAVVGSYSVTYGVSDANGNAAVQVTRTVNVVDTTVPVITLVGADPVTVEVGSAYGDAGATAFDIGDGDLTWSIITVNPVNTAVVGAYTITYDVSDTNGNPAATVVRMVNVVDTTIPVITLMGANPQTIEVGSVYSELGATAFDNYDGDVTASIVINSGVVNTAAVGSYAVVYDVTDAAGNPSSAVRVVNVVDTGLPVITLIGANPQTIQVGATHAELGATAFDANDGNLSSVIVIDVASVNPAVVGTYPVTYDVSDAAGNAAVQVTRMVNVVDTTAPAISLVGANPLLLEAGSPFVDPGASAFDAYDGDISGSIVANASLVNTSRLGSYPVTYNVADSEGNPALTVTRTVNVVDTTAPVISLVGPNPLSLFVGGIYLEPGASAIDGFDGTISGSIVVDASALNLAAAGTYPVFYSVVDSSGNPATAMRLVFVVVPNSPPIAVDDRYTVNDVGEIGVPAPGVLGNDTDIDGDALTVTLVSAPNFGELVLNPSGSFTYSYDGLGGVEDVFIYQVSDGRGGSSRAAVRIVVPVLNQPPVAEDHTAVINEDGVARILVTDGYDAEGDPVVLAVTRQPAAGTASADHGAIVFLPPADWFGEASIGYSLTDSFGSVASGSVSVVVKPVNDPPRAGSDVIVLASYLASILDVLRNDYDVEGEALTILSVTQGEHGTVELVDGKVIYTPHTGWVGTDHFTYTVADTNGATTVVDVSAEVVSSALITAIGLSGMVGTGLLQIDPPEPLTLARVALDTPHAIRLFTQAFFQSLSAMQLPLVLLLFAALWFLVGGTPWATGLLARRRHWAVVWVGPEDKLSVHTEPSERSAVAFKLLPNARGLVSTERPVRDAETGTVWLPVSADIGHGWVNRANVTEDVDSIEFASDLRPNRLVDRLARLRRRGIGSGLFDGRGMFVSLNGQAVNVPGDQVLDILTNDHGGEAPSLLELFLESWRSSTHELAVDAPLERSHLIPAECKNYHYLSVRSPGSPGWMVFFEYRRGRARIAGLGAEA